MKWTWTLLLIPLSFHCCSPIERKEKDTESKTFDTLKEWASDRLTVKTPFAQGTIERPMDSGRIENKIKEGLWVEYSIDTSSENQTEFIIGNTRAFSASPALKKEKGQYVNGKRNGIWTLYNASISDSPFHWYRWSETNYKVGLKDGEEITYQCYGGKPLIVTNWKNNVEDGIGRIYYSDPPYNIQKIFNFIDGQRWLIEAYYPGGNVQTKFSDTIVAGIKMKLSKEYFESRQLKETGLYVNGNEKFGAWTTFYENRVIESIFNYSNGELSGLYKIFHDNGQLWTERIYKKGKLFEVLSNFSRNGEKNDPGTIKKGTGSLYIYDTNGKLIETINFVDGEEETNTQ